MPKESLAWRPGLQYCEPRQPLIGVGSGHAVRIGPQKEAAAKRDLCPGTKIELNRGRNRYVFVIWVHSISQEKSVYSLPVMVIIAIDMDFSLLSLYYLKDP